MDLDPDGWTLFKFYTRIFWFLWLCIMSVGWRERNQQDATNPMFIMKLLYQHVSGIIMPNNRRTRPFTTAYGVLYWLCWLWLANHSQHNQCRTQYAAVHSLVLLMLGIMMPETCCVVQNTICSRTRFCSPYDGHSDAWNMLCCAQHHMW